eukprot:2928081-Pyramimonas_sp.AAC.1
MSLLAFSETGRVKVSFLAGWGQLPAARRPEAQGRHLRARRRAPGRRLLGAQARGRVRHHDGQREPARGQSTGPRVRPGLDAAPRWGQGQSRGEQGRGEINERGARTSKGGARTRRGPEQDRGKINKAKLALAPPKQQLLAGHLLLWATERSSDLRELA